MKKFFSIYGISLLVVLAFTLVFSTVTLANDENGKPAPTATLKFVGNLDNQPVFQLTLTNDEAQEYTIIFKDMYGNTLYTEKTKGSNINKKYMLKSEDLNDGTLHVIVKVKKGNTSESFSITRNTSYVEDTSVSKLN